MQSINALCAHFCSAAKGVHLEADLQLIHKNCNIFLKTALNIYPL